MYNVQFVFNLKKKISELEDNLGIHIYSIRILWKDVAKRTF